MMDGRPALTAAPAPNSVHGARHSRLGAFATGAVVGSLGGLIGLGGAEFRLPLLIEVFRFAALEAVILNKAMSLVVVTSALPFRSSSVPWSTVAENWDIVANLLAGSMLGAWLGAGWAMRLKSATLHRIIAVLLLLIAAVLVAAHDLPGAAPLLDGALLLVAGTTAGVVIGVVASLLGVAGGELLIPTLVLLFGCDAKLAGSLSLVVSLPTMLAGFARYRSDRSFAVLSRNRAFMLTMAVGSILGSLVGALLLGIVHDAVLLPLLATILVLSSIKLWRHSAP